MKNVHFLLRSMLLELLFRLNQCLICAWFVPWCFALLCLISFSFKRLVLVVDRSWFCSVSLGKWITTQPPHPKHTEREKKKLLMGYFLLELGLVPIFIFYVTCDCCVYVHVYLSKYALYMSFAWATFPNLELELFHCLEPILL